MKSERLHTYLRVILLSWTMALSIPMLADAVGDIFTVTTVEGKEMQFTITDIREGTCEVYKVSTSITGNITIPSSAKSYTVIGIGSEAFKNCTGLTAVNIPNTVTYFEWYAFQNCNRLNGITIPNSVTTIKNYTFYDCGSLSSVTIPKSVKDIGSNVFSHCKLLVSIKVESGNPVYDSRDNCNAIIETYTNKLIAGCKNTTIPNTVTAIGPLAFAECYDFTSIVIPNSVTSIGSKAFTGCGLKEIHSLIRTPFAVNNVFDDYAFSGTLYVPIGTKEKYQETDGWKNFKNIVEEGGYTPTDNINFTDDKVKSICVANWDTNGDGELSKTEAAAVKDLGTVFKGSYIWSFNELQFFTGLSAIGESAFERCYGLMYTIIPSSVTSIGEKAFYSCQSLTALNLPRSVTSIGEQAFCGCGRMDVVIVESGNPVYDSRNNSNAIIHTATNELIVGSRNATIPNSVTSIGNHAFDGCDMQGSFTIPNSVTSIGDYAFAYCSELKTVTLPNSLMSIGNEAFANCESLTSITIPNTVSSIGEKAFMFCLNMSEVHSLIGNPFDLNKDVFTYIKDNATLYVPVGTKAKYQASKGWNVFTNIVEEGGETPPADNITFADTEVKRICVENWDTNKDGELSKNEAAAVTDLGKVFRNNSIICTFDELQYFIGLSSIGADAFYNCSRLTSIIIPTNVTSLAGSAFFGCSGLSSFNIPNSVTVIGNYTFADCSGLTSITIPNSVTRIGDYAFAGCNSLEKVTSLIETPFAINKVFDNYSAILYVPAGTKTKYQATEGWKNFKNIVQEGGETPPVENITFADNSIKVLCVNHWDTNKDGELSKEEAAAVTDLGDAFKNCTYPLPFNEFQYFTGLTAIGNDAFRGSSLTSITIPATVSSIGNYVFYGCDNLVSVTIPSTVTNVSDDALTGSNILSLFWNSKAKLSSETLNSQKRMRPNMLIYVTDENVLPQTGMDNVVVDGIAQNIVLAENNPFYCAQQFTARNISFTHNFRMETGKGTSAGWEALALPFSVQTVTHATKGELVPFAKYKDENTIKPFWLYEMGSNGTFIEASAIEANKPYLISMPNNTAYNSEYCLNGKVTFAATNVTIRKTDQTDLSTVSYAGKTFRPTYTAQPQATTVYAINATSDYSSVTGNRTEGSIFIQNLRAVRPFEAYFSTNTATTREYITIEFDNAAVTGLETLLYSGSVADNIRVYNTAGQLVREWSKERREKTEERRAWTEATQGLPPGIYVVQGKKILVRY